MRTARITIVCIAILFIAASAYADGVWIEDASKEQKDLIQSALGDKYPISKIVVTKSGSHKQAYYVGAIFKAQGAGDVIGIWFVGGYKSKPNLAFSVNGDAYHFSGLRRAKDTQAAASIADTEASELRDHLKQFVKE